MKKHNFYISTVILTVITLFSLTSVAAGVQNKINLKKIKGKTYYTKINIWYENPEQILSTNYHRGTIIPAGTKVTIIKAKGGEIRFETEPEVQFVLIHAKKHSTISFEELFLRYFSEDKIDAVDETAGQFSEEERKNIKQGTIVPCMSKEAVVVAYGYPPSHKTPSLKYDMWHYWESRYTQVSVSFSNNRINRIERINQRNPFSPSLDQFVNPREVIEAPSDCSGESNNNTVAVYYNEIDGSKTSSVDIDKINKAAIAIKTDDGHGSGVVINSDGYAVTCFHVVKNKSTVTAYMNGGKPVEASVVRSNKDKDIALIKLPGREYDYLPLGRAETVSAGLEIYTVGAPYDLTLSNSISKGIISGIRSDKEFDITLFQVDAAVNPGNSGGPLVNMRGEVIGIVALKIQGYKYEGLGFAISIDDVKRYLDLKKK